jgi:cell division protein ZapA
VGNIQIKVIIAGRTYPITVDSKEEEEKVKQSAKLIEENIKYLESVYFIKDRQDLLAMHTLQSTMKMLDMEKATLQSTDNKVNASQLEQLKDMLDIALGKTKG